MEPLSGRLIRCRPPSLVKLVMSAACACAAALDFIGGREVGLCRGAHSDVAHVPAVTGALPPLRALHVAHLAAFSGMSMTEPALVADELHKGWSQQIARG
eukprot:TRINITY_DN1212_c0_g2_i1.p3 TRINITY_DN1212_c0_g2~~TRINITY_DN1212_c0_g2_i1.p3  ORF type:complete len:100 (-),score=4.43 TRINITY_DN1212_c0_g2_i1:109-408(-)